MPRGRRSASDIAGQMPAPKWMAMIMIAVALTLVFMVKFGAEEYTGDVMNQLVGDPELELPEGYSQRLNRAQKNNPSNQPSSDASLESNRANPVDAGEGTKTPPSTANEE